MTSSFGNPITGDDSKGAAIIWGSIGVMDKCFQVNTDFEINNVDHFVHELLIRISCISGFHEKCIEKALHEQAKCPICRSPIRPEYMV